MFIEALTLLTFGSFAAAEQRAPAPAPHCLDARAVQEVWPTAAESMLVRSATGQYRLSLSSNCQADPQPSALLARDGWVCGAANEFVRNAGQRCPIEALAQISESEFKQSRATSEKYLANERSKLERSFRGFAENCLDPTRIRSWSVQGDSLIVQASRVRNDSPYAYKVQLSGNCPEASVRDQLSWRSTTGMGKICGIPGEFAVFSSQHKDIANVASAFLSGRPASAELRGCPVQSVEAMHRRDVALR